jgi:hypothetical protein
MSRKTLEGLRSRRVGLLVLQTSYFKPSPVVTNILAGVNTAQQQDRSN